MKVEASAVPRNILYSYIAIALIFKKDLGMSILKRKPLLLAPE